MPPRRPTTAETAAPAEPEGSRARRAQPRRTCVGCRRVAAPSELVRIARRRDGELVVGPGPGRGAWLCAGSEPCFDLAVRRRALARNLRTEIRDDEVGRLRATLYGRPRAEGSPR